VVISHENKLLSEANNTSQSKPPLVPASNFVTLLFSTPLFLISLFICFYFVFPISAFLLSWLKPLFSDEQHIIISGALGAIISFVLACVIARWYFGMTRAFIGWILDGIREYFQPSIMSTHGALMAGAEGEELAISTVSELTDEYFLFNQVDIPSESSRTGFNEADLIVFGPQCVFIIEVKHNTGEISGHSLDPNWRVTKESSGGNEYYSEMRNPIKQVSKLTWLLSKYLKENSENIWIQPIVLFTHTSVRFGRIESDVPILTTEDICPYKCNVISKSVLDKIIDLKKKDFKIKH